MIEQVSNISPIDVAISKLQKPVIARDMRITHDFTVACRAFINQILASDAQCREQFTEWVDQKKAMTEALHNDRGMSTGEELKVCINMPELLGLYVFKQFPEALENKKNMYKFMKAFPEFTVPKTAFKTKYDSN